MAFARPYLQLCSKNTLLEGDVPFYRKCLHLAAEGGYAEGLYFSLHIIWIGKAEMYQKIQVHYVALHTQCLAI